MEEIPTITYRTWKELGMEITSTSCKKTGLNKLKIEIINDEETEETDR